MDFHTNKHKNDFPKLYLVVNKKGTREMSEQYGILKTWVSEETGEKEWAFIPAKTLTPLTEDECEAIINKHDWFSKSWKEMAKEIHDAILRKAQEK